MLKKEAINQEKNVKLIIEDKYLGYYLYVFELNTGQLTHDYHYFHHELDGLYRHAKEDYGVDKDMFVDI